jgi:hypothetical protein
MDVKPYLEFLMDDVQFYINFGLFSPSSNFDDKTYGVYFSSTLILKIGSKVFSHTEYFVCWLFFPIARGVRLWNVISYSFFTQMTSNERHWEC